MTFTAINACFKLFIMSNQKWPTEFIASDHRLLTAQFDLDQEILLDGRDDIATVVDTDWTHKRRQNRALCSLL